jgi:hypothetical protein
MERQGHYGHAFCRVRAVHSAVSLAGKIAHELVDQRALGLISGALLPPADGS